MKVIKLLAVFFLLSVSVVTAQNKYASSLYLGQEGGVREFKVDDKGYAYILLEGTGALPYFGDIHRNFGGGHFNVIAKLAPSGKLIWARQISPNSMSDMDQMSIDDKGDVYVTGMGQNLVLDDGKRLDGLFLIKINTSGQTEWGISSPNPSNPTSIASAPLIPMPDGGVFWACVFYGKFVLGSYTLQTTTGSSPNTFVAYVDKAGNVTSIYHDRHIGTPQIMARADANTIALVVNRGGLTKNKVLLTKRGEVLSDTQFFNFGMPYDGYYEFSQDNYTMYTPIAKATPFGFSWQGYFRVRMDKFLNVIDSVRLAPELSTQSFFSQGIEYNDEIDFLRSTDPGLNDARAVVWRLENKTRTQWPSDGISISGRPQFTYNFVRVLNDTLHMFVRNYDPYSTSFTFDGKSYNKLTNNSFSWFWVKYVPDDPEKCIRIKPVLAQDGAESGADVRLRFSVPKECPLTDDVVINFNLASDSPAKNINDFVLPSTITLKKGSVETEIVIKVINDLVIEELENFKIDLQLDPLSQAYKLTSPALTFNIEDDDVCTLTIDETQVRITEPSCNVSTGAISGLKVSNATLIEWLDEDGEVIPNGGQIDIEDVLPGKYQIRASNLYCSILSNAFVINAVKPEAMALPPALDDVNICTSGNALITVRSVKKGAYRIYSSNLDTAPLAENTTGIFNVEVPESKVFYVTYNTEFCESTRVPVKVTITADFIIPNTITPNGDGVNDVWLLKNIESYPEARIKIYNRYGSIVFSSIGYTKPFRGDFKQALPDGTYYYLITLKKDCPPIKGSLTLIR